jgi:hypothetical protein
MKKRYSVSHLIVILSAAKNLDEALLSVHNWKDVSEEWFRDSSALPQNDMRGMFINE